MLHAYPPRAVMATDVPQARMQVVMLE